MANEGEVPVAAESQGPSGPTERESQGPSGPTERESQGPSGPTERESQGPKRDTEEHRVLALEPVTFFYIVGGLLLAGVIFGLFRSTSEALTKIGVGIVLALALDPLVGAVRRRWHWSRSHAVLLVMGGVIALVSAAVVIMGPSAADQAENLTSDLPETVEQFYDLPVIGGWLQDNDAAQRVQQTVQDLPGEITDDTISSTIRRLIGGAMTTLTVIAVALAVMLDGEHLIARFRRLLPERWLDEADQIGRVLYVAVARYFGGSLAVAGLMGLFVLMLCLVFKVPLAPLAAVWAMIADLIPQIGGFLAGALLGLLALTQGPIVFIVVLGLYITYMTLENHIIQPAIIGPSVDVTPPTTMLAALIGSAAAGVPGALVATPLVGATKQLYMQFRWGHEPFSDGGPGRLARIRRKFRRTSSKEAPEET